MYTVFRVSRAWTGFWWPCSPATQRGAGNEAQGTRQGREAGRRGRAARRGRAERQGSEAQAARQGSREAVFSLLYAPGLHRARRFGATSVSSVTHRQTGTGRQADRQTDKGGREGDRHQDSDRDVDKGNRGVGRATERGCPAGAKAAATARGRGCWECCSSQAAAAVARSARDKCLLQY